MDIIKYFTLLLILWKLHLNKNAFVKSEEYCPINCQCDSYEGYNRANCRGQNLISASIEISEYVQIMNLDENEIKVLDNQCFQKLINIINLSIAYNSIHTIYFNAFTTLHKLQSIDLSYNRLEHINEKIFEYNQHLIEVNLSGNKFMSYPNQPLFISSSVENLLLRNSQITHIYPTLFSKILSLQHLDLSENLMITLTMEPFNSLEKLLTINLDDNRWICDKNIENLMKLFKSREVTVELNMCHFELRIGDGSGNIDMFEKLIIDPTLNNEAKEKTLTIIDSVWKRLNSSENELDSCLNNNNIFSACTLYGQCFKNLSIIMETFEKSQNHNNNNCNTDTDFFYLISDTQLVFYFGMCIGAALVFVLVACTLCATKICNSKNEKSNSDLNDVISADAEFQYVRPEHPPLQLISSPPPIPVRDSRRRRRRRPPPPPPLLNRSISTPVRRSASGSASDFAAFVTRLFERPSRHRYYRAFNENTAHLIRRLSRSSLVNNRVSQHFLNETARNRNERNANNSNPEVRQRESPNSLRNESVNPELELFVESPTCENNSPNDRLLSNRRHSLEEYHGPNIPRAETPPPSYTDVVK